eukprot:3034339-Karenia_brevis.AAC.1
MVSTMVILMHACQCTSTRTHMRRKSVSKKKYRDSQTIAHNYNIGHVTCTEETADKDDNHDDHDDAAPTDDADGNFDHEHDDGH